MNGGELSLQDIGIAILIELAQQGEIDPWDVQVIDVIDRFLSQLAFTTNGETRNRDVDLSESGQAFLWASMLVLLKADTLGQNQIPDANPDLADVDAWDGNWAESSLPAHLERHLRRRPVAPPPQKRPVTLEDFIAQLQQMAATLEEKPARVRNKRPTGKAALAKLGEGIVQLAHNENLTEIAGELDRFLSSKLLHLATGQDWLDLEHLLQLWSQTSAGVEGGNQGELATIGQSHDRVGVFWALLLLSAQSKVELFQEEFYQDIKIRPLSSDQS